MTCPRCRAEFNTQKNICPECGIPLARSVSGVMKTSAVLIAAGGERSFYRSVQEVPEPLRTQLLETTNSPNSGTIVIADRAGKEQLSQAMMRREAAQAVPELPAEVNAPGRRRVTKRVTWIASVAIAVFLLLSILLSLIFHVSW